MSLIAVGGGKGGVGRTLLTSGLAVFFAQLGRRVLLVDAHPNAPTIPTMFGLSAADGMRPPWAPLASDARGAETAVHNVRVLCATSELGGVHGISRGRPREIAQHGGADVCIVDLGPGIAHGVLDAMLDADSMIVVTTPEPAAVEALFRFARHAFVRSLERSLRGHPREIDCIEQSARDAFGAPWPIALAHRLAAVSDDGAQAAWQTLHRMRIRIVVNGSRSRADLDLGELLAIVSEQRLGIAMDYLGHVEFDDAVILAARHRRPLLVDAPAARASRNLERVARRLIALESGRTATPHHAGTQAAAPAAPTHYDVLALDRGASDEEIRRAYRRMREAYGPDSLAIAGVLTPAETATAVARIEESRDVLLDPARRRPYDLSITAPEDLRELADRATRGTVPELPAELVALPDLTPDTEYTGQLLRTIREARGVEIRDIAARTKISATYLRAIEEEDFASLPAYVYARGFVIEVAKFHRLDTEQVVRTYLRRYRRAMDEQTE